MKEFHAKLLILGRWYRWIKRRYFNSVRKTGKAIVVEESPKTGGWGGEVIATIAEEASEELLAPLKRVAALDTPIPFAPVMEDYYVPSAEKIKSAIIDTYNY